MAKELQLRGGTTAEHSAFTGAVREVTVDTDKDTLVVHDGVTAGGFPLAKEGVSYSKAEVDTLVEKAGSISKVASSVLNSYSNLAIDATTPTKNFDVITYTGNGTSQLITTGISSVDFTVSGNGSGYWLDRSVNQVKNDAGVVQASGSCVCNVSKVHIKSRSIDASNVVLDSLRGDLKVIYTDTTAVEATATSGQIQLETNGFSVGSTWTSVNTSGATYVAYQTLYTHIKWGTTNQGKFYVEAYNPVTREGMIYYIGSGLAGHEIPHSQGVELDYVDVKSMNAYQWGSHYEDGSYLVLDSTSARNAINYLSIKDTDKITINATTGVWNTTDVGHITYYKAKSETWTIVQYQGNGAKSNFVETKDVNGVARKPRRVILKGVDTTYSWFVLDTERGEDNFLLLDASGTEDSVNIIDVKYNGFELKTTGSAINKNDSNYIALVEFDTTNNNDGSYFDYPTDDTNLSITGGVFPYTNGKDDKGFITTSENFTGQFDFTGVADGLYWVAKEKGATGTLTTSNGLKVYDKKPSVGLYDKTSADDNRLVFQDGKWYTTTGGELVTNGTFDNGTTGYWASGATLNNNDNVLNVVGGTTNYPKGVLDLSGLVVGEKYKLSVDIIATGDATSVSVYESGSYSLTYSHQYGLSTGTHIVEFTAEYTTLRILLGNHSATDNQTTKFDNVSLFKLEPTLSTPVSTPISFLPNPVMVASETPMYIDYNNELAQNVVESIEASGDIKTNTQFIGKNACTAWVNFDGTTTPPTIRDSYNVSSVIRIGTGVFDIYFEETMDNKNYSINATAGRDLDINPYLVGYNDTTRTTTKITCTIIDDNGTEVSQQMSLQVFGGKN